MGGFEPDQTIDERVASAPSAPHLNVLETWVQDYRPMRDGLTEEMRRIIAGIAAGAGDGAGALRQAGIPVELEGFIVEAMVEPGDSAPATSVRLVFCRGEPRAENQEPRPES